MRKLNFSYKSRQKGERNEGYLVIFVLSSFFIAFEGQIYCSTLEFNKLQLRNGSIVTFSSFSKLGDKALQVVTEDGKKLLIPRKKLSDAEIIRRFGSLVPMHYGKAVYVSSKLPEDFNIPKFKSKCEGLVGLLKKGHGNYSLPYWYFAPEPDRRKKKQKVPLVVFFHGMGECSRKGDLKKLFFHPQVLNFISPENQKEFPCFFMAAQLPAGYGWTGEADADPNKCTSEMRTVITIIDDMIKHYPNIDDERIYLTGLSSGGIASLEAINKFPEKFAGAVPVSGGSQYNFDTMINKQKIAIWAFCNPNEEKYIRGTTVSLLKKAAKFDGDCRYTKFDAKYIRKTKNGKIKEQRVQGHVTWLWAYAEPDLIPWLFAHKREEKEVR